jgi:ATP-dependent DNA helicase RecG
LEAGLVEMTLPDKPQSKKQKYRLTDAGKKALAKLRKNENGKTTNLKTNLKDLQLLEWLKIHPNATLSSLVSKFCISRSGIKYQLANLKKAGFLKRVGGRKQGYWLVIANDSE